MSKYKITDSLGKGGFGVVFAAVNRATGKKVAIKMIEMRKESYFLKKVVREIIILRKLSEMKDNVFSNKLLDIIIPEGVVNEKQQANYVNGKIEKKEVLKLEKLTHIFLVLEKSDRDLK